MATLRDDPLFRFSTLSFLIMVFLAITIGFLMASTINDDLALLTAHGEAMIAGELIEPDSPISIAGIAAEHQRLRLTTLVALVGGLFILYAASVYVVRRGWIVIRQQQHALRKNNELLEVANSRLITSEERYRTLIKSAPIGIASLAKRR